MVIDQKTEFHPLISRTTIHLFLRSNDSGGKRYEKGRMILEWRETTVHYTYYNSLLAGLSQQEKNKERIEEALCRPSTRSSV